MMQRVLSVVVITACGGGGDGDQPHPPDAEPPGAAYSLDPAFGVQGVLVVSIPDAFDMNNVSMVPATDAVWLVANVSTTRTSDVAVCRMIDPGVLDPGFAGGCILPRWTQSVAGPSATAVGASLLVATQSFLNDPVAGVAVFRIGPDGALEPSWGINGAVALAPPEGANQTIQQMVAAGDGSVVVMGTPTFFGGVSWAQRVQADGALDPAIEVGDGELIVFDDRLSLLVTHNAFSNDCPPTPCAAGEVCRYASCTPPLMACPTDALCPPGTRCDAGNTSECLPDAIDGVGTDVTRMTSALAIEQQFRVPHVNAERAFALTSGAAIVTDDFAGLWKLTPEGAQDPAFGTDGTAPIRAFDAAERTDGGIVVVTDVALDELGIVEITAAGREIARVRSPTPGVSITSVHVLSDTLLLVAGRRGGEIVVQRLIRTVF